MDETVRAEPRPARHHARAALILAVATAAIGWIALVIEGRRAISASLQDGRSLPEALYLYFRYFTILTNIGIATLLSVTSMRLALRRPLPAAALFNAGLVYILVTCLTYEIMLRHQWRPRGLQFITDMTLHDIVPALMLCFWLGFAPRAGVRWRDALWLLAYPAGYFAMTLVAGAMGETYPYSFLDAGRLGLPSVLVVAAVFLTIFFALGTVTTACAMASAPQAAR